MGQVHLATRRRRWEEPFGRERMPAELVGLVLQLPAFEDVDPGDFPDDLTLHGIIANDARFVRFKRGDIVFRKGSFHTSLFIVVAGAVRAVSGLPGESPHSKPELSRRLNESFLRVFQWPALRERFGRGSAPDCGSAARKSGYTMGRNAIFGEMEALTREPRRCMVISDAEETWLLEIRWPGLRALRQWSDVFHRRIDAVYRRRSLSAGVRDCPLLAHLDDSMLDTIAGKAQFKSYGDFGWTYRYQREERTGSDAGHEPLILKQDDYLEDLLLVRAGFVRVSVRFDHGEKTVDHLSAGDVYGLDEIMASSREEAPLCAERSLHAMGYADIIRIPVRVVETSVLPFPAGKPPGAIRSSPDFAAAHSLLDFMVDRRLINGTRAMVIDTNRCVNCDECVRACAATHDNIPRFVRQGPVHDMLMVAQACMHCTDPVCLIDCPTDAIHREAETGSVVIDEATCIGCGTCAGACPYGNIRMEQVRNGDGALHIDAKGAPVLRATKCDLCAGRSGGPACQRACPHDALQRVDINDIVTRGGWREHPR